MISPIEEGDFDELSSLVAAAVRASVADNEEDARFLIQDILHSLKKWQTSESEGFNGKYSVDGAVAGFVIVKEYWNLETLPNRPLFVYAGMTRSSLARGPFLANASG